jgi:HAD superfamily hydrolase (TIGR01509 family)
MKYSCFLFDLDNTLVVSEPIIFAAINHVAEKYTGKRYTPDQIRSLYGPPERGMIEAIVAPGVVTEAVESFHEYYEQHHDQHAYVIPGIRESLQKLYDAGASMAIITGKGSRSTETTLRLLGLRQFFGALVTGETVRRWKPDPAPALRALQILTKSPAEALFVGDQLADLGCARAAGVDFAAALWESFQKERMIAERPTLVFWKPEDFSAWVEKCVGVGG